MRRGALERLLARYGQTVEFYPSGVEPETPETPETPKALKAPETPNVPERTVKAVLQPAAEQGEAWGPLVPTPLGTVRRDRFLYVGPPEAALDVLGDGYLACRGVRYEVQEARAVFVGDVCSHWWGLLRAREADEAEGGLQ